jgi:polyphosphate kinase
MRSGPPSARAAFAFWPRATSSRERAFLDRLFASEIFPVLTPAAIDPALPFPHVTNLVLYLAVRLEKNGEEDKLAIVQLPRTAARWIQVAGRDEVRFVLLEDVVRGHIGELFGGHTVVEVVAFRVTRDADFATDDQEAEDLVDAVRQVLRSRLSGDPVRLEIEEGASDGLVERLAGALGLSADDVFRLPPPLDLKFLTDFARIPTLPAPRAEAWTPQPRPDIPPGDAIWDAIAERDILLFHPYESFEPVLRLLRLAAEDPSVMAIKQTL